jgi:hypothetical protein
MKCSECEALRQQYRSATRNFGASIRDLVRLVDNSASNSDFNLVHLRIGASRGTCKAIWAAVEYHQAEHWR